VTKTNESKRTVNLKWLDLDQDDKEVVVRLGRESPEWARVLLYGETRSGSAEENAVLLRYKDSLPNALFIETADQTVRMIRYNNAVVRLLVPNELYMRAWKREEAFLGLSGLDDSLDLIHAVMVHFWNRSEEKLCFPFQRFGAPRPSWREDDFNIAYFGGFILFKKSQYMDVPLSRFFAGLPQDWLGNLGLRKLDDQEASLALSVGRRDRTFLTNGELEALRVFAKNSRLYQEKHGR
jgi:hypothetical protein